MNPSQASAVYLFEAGSPPAHVQVGACRKSLFWLCLWLACFPLQSILLAADSDHCAVCGEVTFGMVYLITDAVAAEKVAVCTNCEAIYPNCFLCGLPAKTNVSGFLRLPDGRSICARDAGTAVLQEGDGLRICSDVRDRLDQLFWRFMAFPQTNVAVAIMDRVHLQELFKFAGNDYHCPNVWGYTQSSINCGQLEHRISVLSGLLPRWLKATCAHEYAHTWVHQHISSRRMQTLGRDAEEGFCELISYLLMDAEGDEAQKSMILRNGYTRRQIELFIAAQNQYGLNEVIDWIKFGVDDRLSADDPGRVRKLELPAKRPVPTFAFPTIRTSTPSTLLLKGVFWNDKQPVAIINDRSFTAQEQAKVPLGASNVIVRCVRIRRDAVTIRVAGCEHDQELVLKQR